VGATLRILSANLWNGRADAADFAKLVAEERADVVAVQELGHEQAEALSLALPHGLLQPDTDHDGGGIALAGPGAVERLPLARRDGYRVRLDPAEWPQLGRPVEVLNVHVFAPHAGYGRGLLRRPPQVRDLVRHVRAPAPGGRVLVGDFNATPLWPAYRRVRRHLEDAAVLAARRAGRHPVRTWGPRHGAPRLLRIDHGFVQGVAVESFRVVPIPGSDHSAVLLEVAVDGGGVR